MDKNTKITIAYLIDIDVDYIVDMHIAFHCNLEGKPKPSRMILKQKYQYMLHLIITRCKFHKDGICYLHAQFYRDHIFNDHFSDMLSTLCRMAIISMGSYQPKKHSSSIRLLDWNISYRTVYNKKFIKWEQALEKWKPTPKYERNEFTDYYNDCLRCLRLTDKKGAQNYIKDNLTNKSEHKYHYYKACVDEFNSEELGIKSIDEQGRIYHFLTSLPKDLREYYNIKYELDVANSHPLLLNKYLIEYYNIDYNILLFMYSNIIYHYDVEYLSEILKINNLELNDVPMDVIEYIAKTQHGKFYDDFISEFGDIERSEIKKKVFSQVFYSHLDAPFVSKFCKAFINKYPNVWEVIHKLKVKTGDKLPHMMMNDESNLFKPIIEECWLRGWKVVNLHDALIVFDVEENKAVEVKELKAIIEEQYNKLYLLPTVKLEIGSE